MATEISTATDFLNLHDKLVIFLTGLTTPGFSGTGEGDIHDIRITNSAVTETWTITFTSASAFTVTGSVSGAQASGTVGTAYTNTYIGFTIYDGPVAFVATDAFTLSVTTNSFNTTGAQWTLNGDRAQGASSGDRLRRFSAIMGPGATGTDEIYLNLVSRENTATPYHNMGISGAISFDESAWTDNAFGRADALALTMINTQPGFSSESYAMGDNVSLNYWLVADGRMFILQYKITTLYLTMGGGLFLPYGSPLQYPYPLFVGAQDDASNTPLSSTSENFRCFWDSGPSSLRVRLPSGSWQSFENVYDQSGNEANSATANVWPWQGVASTNTRTFFKAQRSNRDGTYTLYPALLNTASVGDLGEIPYVYAVSGFNNSSESSISESGNTYIVFQNIFRTDRWHFYALQTA